MRVGIVGLGRMGRGLATEAVEAGHEVIGWDPDGEARETSAAAGIRAVPDLGALARHLDAPRLILMWVPHGDPVDANLEELRPELERGDVVADCGNSDWRDSRRRHDLLAEEGISFLDIGTSGGITEAMGRRGAAFMVGGDRQAYEMVAPLLRDLAVDTEAVYYAGPSPSGHFVKLVHNAIEFGMIQAIAEGVALLRGYEESLDLAALFEHWNHGSVIRGWLVALMANALREEPTGPDAIAAPWDELSTYVEDTGEVTWVLQWALEQDVPTPVIATAQQELMWYRDVDRPAAKAVALLRNQFGGHPVHRRGERR